MSVTIDDTAKTPIRHFQLEGLKPNKRYKLIARAQNGFGWSDYSEEFIFRTAPGELVHCIPVHKGLLYSIIMIENSVQEV